MSCKPWFCEDMSRLPSYFCPLLILVIANAGADAEYVLHVIGIIIQWASPELYIIFQVCSSLSVAVRQLHELPFEAEVSVRRAGHRPLRGGGDRSSDQRRREDRGMQVHQWDLLVSVRTSRLT